MQVYNIPLDNTHMETTRHGTPDFPLAIYTTRISRNILGYIDWHWHTELQFCLVTEGVVEFYVNRSHFILSKGEGIFINTEQLHMAKNYNNIDSTYICLDFHPRLISGFEGSITQQKYVKPYLEKNEFAYCILHRETPWQGKILDLIEEVSSLFHSDEPDEMQITLWLGTLWHTLISSYSGLGENITNLTLTPQVRNMLEYIRATYTRALTLEEIAASASLARSTCCREFKKQMGCTIFDHILNLRLQKAAHLLSTTALNITEITLQCGFENSSYFTKKFRQQTGMSPSVYRKNITCNQ